MSYSINVQINAHPIIVQLLDTNMLTVTWHIFFIQLYMPIIIIYKKKAFIWENNVMEYLMNHSTPELFICEAHARAVC